jgi:hypothetical protein
MELLNKMNLQWKWKNRLKIPKIKANLKIKQMAKEEETKYKIKKKYFKIIMKMTLISKDLLEALSLMK